MPSPTETAILALVAALAAKAAEALPKIPNPERNQDLVSRLADIGDGLARHLNVLDGERSDADEMLGADIVPLQGETYDITQHVRVEWIVAGGDSAAREQAFDDGRKAIWDAIRPVIVDGAPVFLGGAVSALRFVDILPHERTVVAGLPNTKGAEFTFALTFTSPDPF